MDFGAPFWHGYHLRWLHINFEIVNAERDIICIFFYFQFGSWTYDGFKLDIDFFDDLDAVDLNDYIESNEWDVLANPAAKNVKYYPCCVEPYPDLTFSLKLRRKVAFYNYILILPCVLLSSLTLVLFWLPPESPAKMVLGK